MSLLIEFTQHVNGFQILAATVGIWNPLAIVAAVVQVQHAGHRVHSQAIDVVFVQPEQCVGDQEITNFVAAIIEDHRAPVGMLALSRIGVFVQRRAVELPQAMSILGEVGRNPVEDDADAILVAVIDEVHEVFADAVATGYAKVADGLIAPRAGERMLADRHQFDVGEAHFLAVLDQLVGDLAIVHPAVVALRIASPAAQVQFVDIDGFIERICGWPVGQARLDRSTHIDPTR